MQYIRTSFLMDKIFSDTSSFRIVPSSLSSVVENEEEELLEGDISDFQLVESDALLITDLEETENMEIGNIGETTLENRVMPDCVPINVQDKSTSNFLISNNRLIKIGSSQSDISNNSTMNNEINMAGSSKNTTSSIYATEEANAIFLVLGDPPLLLEKYDRAKVLYKQGKISDDFKTFLIDMQSKLQRQVLQQVSILKQKVTEWDRSFLINNNTCSPSPSDYQNIVAIIRKLISGNKLLREWNIVF